MDIGSQLRAAREAQSLTLEQVFKATRIKLSYLEAIEANQFQTLPGPVQARGFVRTYANFLGLDGEHLASALDAEKESPPEVRPISITAVTAKPIIAPPPNKPIVSTPPNKPSATAAAAKPPIATPDPSTLARPGLKTPPLGKPPGLASSPGGIPNWVLIAGAVVLFVLGALLIITALNSGAQSPAPGESLNVPGGAAQTALTDRVLTNRRASDLAANEPVSITLQTGEHVWARITVDGQTAFEGTLRPGTVQDWQAEDSVILETGNAAAVYVLYRGQIAPLGGRGQIVAREWNHAGVTDIPLAAPAAQPASMSQAAPQAARVATTVMP